MQMITLVSPAVLAAALLPALLFAGMAGLLEDAPSEWGVGALVAWLTIWAAVMAGGILSVTAASPIAWLAILFGFTAMMIGGPPGLVVAGAALGVLLVSGEALAAPRWLPAVLAGLALAVAVRRMLF